MSKLPGYEKCGYRDHSGNFEEDRDMEPKSSKLFGLQDQVERLPVPPLEHTMEVFLKSARPHVTPEEFKETERKAKEFFKPGGLAHVLQDRLLKKKESLPNTSWFIKYWNEVAYLGYRDSIVWNVSYFLQFQDEMPFAMNPTRRAARFISHALGFRSEIMNGTLSPDMNKDKPMSNSQYKYLFNATRMPGANQMDFVRTYAGDLYNNIVVVRKNRFFSFDVVDKSTGKPLTVDEIQAQMHRAVAIADRLGTDPYPVGILTAEDRDVWFRKRELLTKELNKEQCSINAACLEKIQSAILVVCFEDSAPSTREEVARGLLHGNGRNRFWDKAVQLVFYDNGKGGCTLEHALMDGTTTTRMVNACVDTMFKEPHQVAAGMFKETTFATLPEPEYLEFALDSRARAAIQEAEKTFDDIIATKELRVMMFHGYGKNLIKKFKVSPDAYAQLVMQYAYYLTFGCNRGTYESTQTRSFLHGRTEVTRSVTVESADFCRTMSSGKASIRECHEKLLAATQAHSSYSAKASKGMGCDRHFSGLKMMMQPGESAELFSDPAFTRSSTWAVSTSGLGGEHLDGWGFGEVVPHGLGIGYSVQNDRLRFTVTSRHQWADRMCANLETALLQMRDLCLAAQSLPSSKL